MSIVVILLAVLVLLSHIVQLRPPDRSWGFISDCFVLILEVIEEGIKPVLQSLLVLIQMGSDYFIFWFTPRQSLA